MGNLAKYHKCKSDLLRTQNSFLGENIYADRIQLSIGRYSYCTGSEYYPHAKYLAPGRTYFLPSLVVCRTGVNDIILCCEIYAEEIDS